MSRRKQSNPKPLKRKNEDTLEEVAELLHLPTKFFSVRDPEDDVQEYTLYTNCPLRKGTHFGPYSGHHTDGDKDGLNVVETIGRSGEDAHFAVTEDSGGWLKLLRPALHSHSHNATLFHNDSAIWCSIVTDLLPESEVVVDHRWSRDLPPTDSDNSNSPKQKTFVEEKKNSPYQANGSSDVVVLKYEPTNPVSPNCSAASPAFVSRKETDFYMNGYPPAFPYSGLLAESLAEGHFKCDACDISFNSRRILEIHQSYYCQVKLYNVAAGSDTDTEDNAHKAGSRNASSPVESEGENLSLKDADSRKESVSRREENNSAIPAKRRRIASVGDVTSQESVKTSSRPLRCPYCSYSTDKKASLTRHVRMHATATNGDGHCDLPIPTPPMARYCANCDIQFASYKNYQVHKEFYCNTRHVHKAVPECSPTSSEQQQTQPQTQQQQQQQQNQPSTTSSPTQPQSPESTTKNYTSNSNMVLNQPLYAAISTSPLILVPCSYVAGGGSAGLIPAGNIIIPNPPSATSSGTPDSKSEASVIPTYTVVPSSTAVEHNKNSCIPSPDNLVVADNLAMKDGKDQEKLEKENQQEKNEGVNGDTEKPLDLSCKKCDKDSTKMSPKIALKESSNQTQLPPAYFSEEKSSIVATQSLPIIPVMNSNIDIELLDRNQFQTMETAQPQVIGPPPVLVKQGTSKCKECNIVFYKYENYLVHKNRYCAARDVLSPVKSPSLDESGTSVVSKSPVSSPRIYSSRTPPVPAESLDNREQTSPNQASSLFQYYCMSCGIKYTSLDNLRAHQLYYCPKRDTQTPNHPSNLGGFSRNSDFKCNKCKNTYPTEELLRQHPCVVQRKCPYCDVYCPTLSAAQRHLVTHTGIKSFRCSLCGYKGHTLRGMRTHIRIHLDKNSSTPEEAYILCMDEGGSEIGCASRKSTVGGSRVNSERIKSVISTEPPLEIPVSLTPAILPADVVAVKPEDPVATGDTTHWCQICGYSSSYKGNVVRHVKLVHKDLIATQAMSNIVVNCRPTAESAIKQVEDVSRVDSTVDHSNSSSSSVDLKPIVNGVVSKTTDDTLVVKSETVSPPPVTDSMSKCIKKPLEEEGQCPNTAATKAGQKYCKSCDISFNYLSNFLAHKKFYCIPRPDVSGQDSNTAQSVQ